MLIGQGITVFVAAATAARIGRLAFLVATLIAHPLGRRGRRAPAAVSLGGAVGAAQADDPARQAAAADRAGQRRGPQGGQRLPGVRGRSSAARRLAHEYMTGMIIGSGVVAAIAADHRRVGTGTVWGPICGGSSPRSCCCCAAAPTPTAPGRGAARHRHARRRGRPARLADRRRPRSTAAAVRVRHAADRRRGRAGARRDLPRAAKFSPPLRRTVDIMEAILIAVRAAARARRDGPLRGLAEV